MMAHFYGSLSGQAGPATRMGSKRSGYTAWAQNRTGRVVIHLVHNSREDRDLASIVIDGSTVQYGGGARTTLGNDLDLSALVRHGNEPAVRKALDAASEALSTASHRAAELDRKAQS